MFQGRLENFCSSSVLTSSSLETTINQCSLGIPAATYSGSSRLKSGCQLVQFIPVIPFCYATEENSNRMKHKYLQMERGSCNLQVVMILHTAVVDCKHTEAHSSLHRLFGQVFPQFLVQFSCGLFPLTSMHFMSP